MSQPQPGPPSRTQPPVRPTISRGWLWAVRILALVCMAVLFLPYAYILMFSAVVYALVLFLLWKGEPRQALALAIGTAVAMLVLSAWLPNSSVIPRLGRCEALLMPQVSAAVAAAQVALLVAAAKALSTVRGDRVPPGPLPWVVPIGLLVVTLIGGSPLVERRPFEEREMFVNLREIRTGLDLHSVQCGGYPASLDALNPPPPGFSLNCEALGVIDPVRLAGRAPSYRILYEPGDPDPNGVIRSYSLWATRQSTPSRNGERKMASFFSNESGQVYWTCEERPANANDQPVSP